MTIKVVKQNPYGEKFDKPALIIANHQSFIDVLQVLSLTPKIVAITNKQVWNSPIVGWILHFIGGDYAGDDVDKMTSNMRKKVAEGYSIVIFPEGTRSADCSVQRFHKGAFLMAEQLHLDILPAIVYGTGLVCSKHQSSHVKRGLVLIRLFERIKYGDKRFGETYQEQSKNWHKWFIDQHDKICAEYGSNNNPYFKDALIKNYIYKQPLALESYIRVRNKLDEHYDLWDKLISREATITDVGCGYGQLSYMLSLLSHKRHIICLDYDEDKIALARHSYLKNDNIDFQCADMRTCDFPNSDVFIFNDSLHYVQDDIQENILKRCLKKLQNGGMIIIRDGDNSNVKGQKLLRKIEKWSKKRLHSNKNDEQLNFVSKDKIEIFATQNHLTLTTMPNDRKASKILYILKLK